MPTGLHLVNNGDGTATISGTPAARDTGTYSATIIASATNQATATQTLMITVDHAPVFKSKAKDLVHTGTAFSYPITTVFGDPVPTITTASTLPGGVTLTDNHNGTAALAGTPDSNAGGVYPITITTTNGIGAPVNQSFLLVVYQAPVIAPIDNTAITAGAAMTSLPITVTGYPEPRLRASGLPPGITLILGSIAGTTSAAGTYTVTITGSSKAGSATQTFTLVVASDPYTYSCAKPAHGSCSFAENAINFVGMNDPYVTSGGAPSLGSAVNNNFNSPISGETQTLYANSASQWQIVNNTPTNPGGAITVYPSNATYAYTGVLDDYTSLTESYNLTMPIAGVNGTNTNSVAWATSDDWFTEPGKPFVNIGGLGYEVQIHVDTSDSTGWHNCGSHVVANPTINGQSWLACDYQGPKNANGTCNGVCGEFVFILLSPGGTTYANAVQQPTVSGTLDLKAMYQWLEDNDIPCPSIVGGTCGVPYMEPGSALAALSRGWEIVSTGGATQTFAMNGFSLDAVGAPTPPSSAPTGVTFTPGSTKGTCVVRWNAVSGATAGYGLWSSNIGFVRVASGTSYTVTGTSGTPLGGVEVAASNNGGNGPYSGFTGSCTPS